MPKIQTIFFCQNCGAQSTKWIGRCPSCNEWNTYVEEVVSRETASSTKKRLSVAGQAQPRLISEINIDEHKRINSGNSELNRVLGGGIVPGSLVLIGGEPGIGKSTLMLQVALSIKDITVLYITGEESEQQIKMRSERISADSKNCYILNETNTQNIFQHIEKINPGMVVIDSVQTLQTELIESSAGSISQIRECTSEFQKYSKLTSTPVFLIGHITKDGNIAGPKILEHMVDTVLQFEGDRNNMYRILRSVKNRFGSTSELGIFEMQSAGLREVSNPSEILLSQRDENHSGIAVSSTIEGLRPLLIEVQSLVSSAAYGNPQRSSTGFDLRRMNMLLAVLEKRCGFRLGAKDVFLNIAGGIRVDDPAIDLAVMASVLSSNEDIAVDMKSCFAAEVGLSGEIRAVNRIEQRISEAEKLGFNEIVISKYNANNLNQKNFKIKIIAINKIEHLLRYLFG
ncbi:MAG TPA: DNA repair protein RadA [Bacteroidales bacterium]|nr:DNA repair protein RadA [Bacteroidales bacterium]HOH83158.1 DNA repair protein RadA [Bacteroidales bacterium]HPI30699.1 DNA repair protein RadA [Bacteroidales bacterium]